MTLSEIPQLRANRLNASKAGGPPDGPLLRYLNAALKSLPDLRGSLDPQSPDGKSSSVRGEADFKGLPKPDLEAPCGAQPLGSTNTALI